MVLEGHIGHYDGLSGNSDPSFECVSNFLIPLTQCSNQEDLKYLYLFNSAQDISLL